MSRLSPRPKNPPPDRRQEILEAALRVFAQRGYEAATNAAIARDAGVTAAALYYYFPSKEDLFLAAVVEREGRISPVLAEAAAQFQHLPPEELLPQVMQAIAHFLSEERTQAVLRIVLAEGPRHPELVRLWEERVAAWFGALLPYLNQQMAQGRLQTTDPKLFMLALHGPLLAAVIARDFLQFPLFQSLQNQALVEYLCQHVLAPMLRPPTPPVKE